MLLLGVINPLYTPPTKIRNNATQIEILSVSALTVRSLLPRSLIMYQKADARLVTISIISTTMISLGIATTAVVVYGHGNRFGNNVMNFECC